MLLFKHARVFFSRFLLSRKYKIQVVARVGRKSAVALSGLTEASYSRFFIGLGLFHPGTLGVEESSSPKAIPTRTSNGPRASGGAIREDYLGNRGKYRSPRASRECISPPQWGGHWAFGANPKGTALIPEDPSTLSIPGAQAPWHPP